MSFPSKSLRRIPTALRIKFKFLKEYEALLDLASAYSFNLTSQHFPHHPSRLCPPFHARWNPKYQPLKVMLIFALGLSTASIGYLVLVVSMYSTGPVFVRILLSTFQNLVRCIISFRKTFSSFPHPVWVKYTPLCAH